MTHDPGLPQPRYCVRCGLSQDDHPHPDCPRFAGAMVTAADPDRPLPRVEWLDVINLQPGDLLVAHIDTPHLDAIVADAITRRLQLLAGPQVGAHVIAVARDITFRHYRPMQPPDPDRVELEAQYEAAARRAPTRFRIAQEGRDDAPGEPDAGV